jgi:hypothetical protein
MNSFPTNNYTIRHDANHLSVPFTPHQFESRNEDSDAPTFINHLFSNDLRGLGVSRGTLSRHVNPLFRRRLINVRRRRHVRPGAIPEGSPSQTAGFNARPQDNLLATVAPGLTIHPLDDTYTHSSYPSASLSPGPGSTMFDRDVPQRHVGQGMFVPQGTPELITLPQSNTHAAVAPQLTTVDVSNSTSDPSAYPSASWASFPSGSSSTRFENGEQLSFSSIQTIPMPMTSELVTSGLTSSSSSRPLTWMTPIIHTSEPVVNPWDANTVSTGVSTVAAATGAPTTSASAEPQQVSRCACCKRVRPFVRVDDTIEWVRPDVMKMVLYFNWSPNAETEAHESWEP